MGHFSIGWFWLRLLIGLVPLAGHPAAAAEPEAEPIPDLTVRMTARDFDWTIRYPGDDQLLDTADDRLTRGELHLPAGIRVRILLASDDRIYSLHLPDYHVRQIAVPNLEHDVVIQTGKEALHAYLGDQFCGFSHDALNGPLIVESTEAYQQWVASLDRATDDRRSSSLKKFVADALNRYRRAGKPASP